MAVQTLTSNPQVVTPGNTNEHTIELANPMGGEKTFCITVTVGSFQINALGPINSNSATATAGADSAKVFITTNQQKVICYIKAGSGSSSLNISKI